MRNSATLERWWPSGHLLADGDGVEERRCQSCRVASLELEVRKPRRVKWSPEEVEQLKKLAGERVGLSKISRILKRTPSTVVAKALAHGVSLTLRV